MDSGAFAQLTCVVSHGDMPITITWSLKGQELNSGPSITTNMLGQRASILVISSVDYSHVGEYTCRATNPAGSVTHSANLRVNGNTLVTKGKAVDLLFFFKKTKTVLFLFRATANHPVYVWKASNRCRRLCPAYMRRLPRRHADHHHLESQGSRVKLWAKHCHHDGGHKDQHVDHLQRGLQSCRGIYVQSLQSSWICDSLGKFSCKW